MAHWYKRDGSAVHTIAGRSGDLRPTTLRDARKLDLLPSVTTIIKEANPGKMLQDWITNQAILSALNHPGGTPRFTAPKAAAEAADPGVKAFLDWCRDDSAKYVRDRAELGSAIHDALNKSFVDPDDVPAHFLAHVDGARSVLAALFGGDRVWHPERTHACALGFGGSIDLESEEPFEMNGDRFDGIMLDFKCKEFDVARDPSRMVFDEHLMQLAAYEVLRNKRNTACGNVFVSTTEPGLSRIVMHSREDIARGRAMFTALNDYWRAKNKYTP